MQKLVELYDENATFSGECDVASVGIRKGREAIRDYFAELFKDAAHISVSFKTKATKQAVLEVDGEMQQHGGSSKSKSIVFTGYYKISKLQTVSIVECHAKFVFVFTCSKEEKKDSDSRSRITIKLHNSMLTPKGRVHIKGHFNQLMQRVL